MARRLASHNPVTGLADSEPILGVLPRGTRKGGSPNDEAIRLHHHDFLQAGALLQDEPLELPGAARRSPPSARTTSVVRLELLKLPGLHPQLADGAIPAGAVRPLVTLAEIHSRLPAVAVARVLSSPRAQWEEPTT